MGIKDLKKFLFNMDEDHMDDVKVETDNGYKDITSIYKQNHRLLTINIRKLDF